MPTQQLLHKFMDNPVYGQGLSALEHSNNRKRSHLRTLMYHRVDERDANQHLSPSILSATPGNFAEQMSYIATHYQPVSIHDVLASINGESQLPARAVLVTFDDGYCDFAEHAWPVLKQYNIPVVLFVPTDYPDHPEKSLWWDTLYNAVQKTKHSTLNDDDTNIQLKGRKSQAFKELRTIVKQMPHDDAMAFVKRICKTLEVDPEPGNHIMTWAQLNHLVQDGVVLAPHTCSHPILTSVSLDRAVQEAVGSWNDLKQRFGDLIPPVFAYPSGGANETIANRLADTGLQLAFTTQRGISNLHNSHPLLLRRINVSRNTSLNMFRTQLLDLFSVMNRFLH